MAGFDYIRAPGAIIKRSMEIARDEADCSGVPDALLGLALRLVHAGGDANLPKLLRVGGEPAAAMARAIAAGANVLVDAQMVGFGIDRTRLNPKGGSLAIGHPFAATGARILGGLAKQLAQRGSGRGLISVCTAGGMGVTAIVER